MNFLTKLCDSMGEQGELRLSISPVQVGFVISFQLAMQTAFAIPAARANRARVTRVLSSAASLISRLGETLRNCKIHPSQNRALDNSQAEKSSKCIARQVCSARVALRLCAASREEVNVCEHHRGSKQHKYSFGK